LCGDIIVAIFAVVFLVVDGAVVMKMKAVGHQLWMLMMMMMSVRQEAKSLAGGRTAGTRGVFEQKPTSQFAEPSRPPVKYVLALNLTKTRKVCSLFGRSCF